MTKKLTAKEAVGYVKRQLKWFKRDITNKQFSRGVSFGIKRMEYPNFMSFKVADEVLKFKTATKYLDEQISKILKCPICSKTTNKKCWEFKWGTGVEIFWYVPQKKAKPKIPTGMTLQKSLTKTGGQMYFKNGGGKKKTKVLNKKKTKKKVKKGSDNLMTFGIRMPDVRTLEDMLK